MEHIKGIFGLVGYLAKVVLMVLFILLAVSLPIMLLRELLGIQP